MNISAYSQFDCPNGVRTTFNELSYTIDTETNEITFNLACDPCVFEDGGSNCECREDCVEEGYTEEDYIEYEKCVEECHDLYSGNPTDEDYCLDGCEAGLYSTERNCLEDCGVVVPRTKTAETFGLAFDFWWTHGLVASTKGDPDESFAEIFDGEPGNFVHQSNQDFEGQSISWCINYQVFIQYDDGTCCNYVGSQCFHKG